MVFCEISTLKSVFYFELCIRKPRRANKYLESKFDSENSLIYRMSDAWLIAVSTIVSVLLLFMSFLMLVYYSHPDDVSLGFDSVFELKRFSSYSMNKH